MSLTTLQMIQLAGLFVAGLSASYKFQFQSLYYILVVISVVNDLPTFIFASFIHIVVCLISGLNRGAIK